MKSIVLRERESKISMRVVAFYLLVIMISLSILTTLAMVILEAFGITELPSGVLYTLIGKTTPELFAMMYIVIKYLFPAKDRITT